MPILNGFYTIDIKICGVNRKGLFIIINFTSGVPVYINSNSQLDTITSSRRFKDNIVDARNYDISKFRVVNFNHIDDPDNIQVGLIAEEVVDIYPELIAYDNNNLHYTVRYIDLISILLLKVQQLVNKINLL